jgi:hypothetical protein
MAAGGDGGLAAWAERSGRRRCGGSPRGVLRFAFYGRVERRIAQGGRVAEGRQAQDPLRVNVPSRPRQGRGTDNIDRDLWLNEAHEAPPLPDRA